MGSPEKPLPGSREKTPIACGSALMKAWKRSGGRCECGRLHHLHPFGVCHAHLLWERLGADARSSWRALPVPDPENPEHHDYEILCTECFERRAPGSRPGMHRDPWRDLRKAASAEEDAADS